MSGKKTNRRTVVKSAGSLALVGIVGSASADGSMSEDEIRELSQQYLKNGEQDKAAELFEDNGLAYGISHSEKTHRVQGPSDEGDLQTQDRYSESHSELNAVMRESSNNDDYVVSATMELDNVKRGLRHSAWCDDVFAIAYNPDKWDFGSHKPTIDVDDERNDVTAQFDASKYSPEGGAIGAVVDLGPSDVLPPEWTEVEMSIYLNTDESRPPSFPVTYVHNRSTTPLRGSVDSITAGLQRDPVYVEVEYTTGGGEIWDDTSMVDIY